MSSWEREVAGAVITIAIVAVVVGGMWSLAIDSSVIWHDTGVVTDLKHFNQLVWQDNYQIYNHESWTLANVTTTGHGVIHLDSRDDSNCPFGQECAPNMVSGWHLNQTLGLEKTHEGGFLAQDP